MNRLELETLWRDTLNLPNPSASAFERLVEGMLDVYMSDKPFREHVRNRTKDIRKRVGGDSSDNFDETTARHLVADEIGFEGWEDLVEFGEDPNKRRPLLFEYAVAALVRGDFSALESAIGRAKFSARISEWYDAGYLEDEPQTLAEIFSAACMLGHADAAEYLLDKGVDAYAGMLTGLSGFHYAVSSGRLEVVKLLLKRGIPMNVKNMYGGDVFNQALWSAVYEHRPDHAAIVEALINAGAEIEQGSLEWWNAQNVPSEETKNRVADALKNARPL